MCGPTLTSIVRVAPPALETSWQILPEIQFLFRLISPQPCAKPLHPPPNDCEAWKPHGGMPVPRGMPLPWYRGHDGAELERAETVAHRCHGCLPSIVGEPA